MPSSRSESLGVYLHVPFCSVRCSYCDFPTVAGRDDRIEAYLAALAHEVEALQGDLPPAADTVFVGGGTPSRLTPEQLGRILDAVRRRFVLAADAEITLEGNPESLTPVHLEGYRACGVTRISVGVQSLDDAVLRRAGRAHDGAGAIRALRDARRAGFPDVSADLIAGLPGERLDGWADTLRRVADEGPDHVSVYLLETDKDTPLARAVRSGRIAVAEDDDLAKAYETTVDVLEGRGLALYEISNFAREGRSSRHNRKYWSDEPYAGFGNGAHGYVSGARRANRRDVDGYIAAVESGEDPLEWSEPFDPHRRLTEALFLGLRRREGVDLDALAARYGEDPRTTWAEAWRRGAEAGLVEERAGRTRLTREGRVRSNALFAEFV
jgi:oxygen-independent coproporphyrinogen-3 oxidase